MILDDGFIEGNLKDLALAYEAISVMRQGGLDCIDVLCRWGMMNSSKMTILLVAIMISAAFLTNLQSRMREKI
jgi:hypothetical protein